MPRFVTAWGRFLGFDPSRAPAPRDDARRVLAWSGLASRSFDQLYEFTIPGDLALSVAYHPERSGR